MFEFAQYIENNGNIIDQTEIGDVLVSTVFLGINHCVNPNNLKAFETAILGGKYDGHIERCDTWDNAIKQHENMCNKVEGN